MPYFLNKLTLVKNKISKIMSAMLWYHVDWLHDTSYCDQMIEKGGFQLWA